MNKNGVWCHSSYQTKQCFYTFQQFLCRHEWKKKSSARTFFFSDYSDFIRICHNVSCHEHRIRNGRYCLRMADRRTCPYTITSTLPLSPDREMPTLYHGERNNTMIRNMTESWAAIRVEITKSGCLQAVIRSGRDCNFIRLHFLPVRMSIKFRHVSRRPSLRPVRISKDNIPANTYFLRRNNYWISHFILCLEGVK